MAIGREPSGAYEAAFPITLPTGSTGYARAVIPVDQNGNPISGGTGTAANQVQGTSSPGTADDGSNPVKMGAVAATAGSRTLTQGQRTDLLTDLYGNLTVALRNGVNTAQWNGNNQDGVGQQASPNLIDTNTYNKVFNGSGWDRQRGDVTSAYAKAPPLAGTDRSITASTTSQTLMASNTIRSRILIRNDSTVDVWVNFGATAVATAGGGNFKIAANGGSLDLQGTSSAVNIIAASATAAISAREW
ncbi:hypothetical protein [Sphingomonas parapaucimobilis]|uniref:Uncharacterized protein n=1 Tax=Sphingomonas parapaucimobilis NBRC 15100 TaxID=1219049 RepID=A0A0A1W9Z4_9SPHN|nr:hypothetical protein [Sphingomonas parapaucimobilis]GAM01749.1 hypothetical protein SP5_068_01170 [Sphingomonas parapaucimobilis NBRC 15100]